MKLLNVYVTACHCATLNLWPKLWILFSWMQTSRERTVTSLSWREMVLELMWKKTYFKVPCIFNLLKDALSGLRQCLAAESPLTVMKNGFYFTSKPVFVLKIFKLLSWLFFHVAKRVDYKDMVNLKFMTFTAWLTNNCNTHITQYLEK